MAEGNRDLWLSLIFEVEGGYVNNADDKGGPTNMGVTLKTLRDWRGDDDLQAEDVAQLTKEDASGLFLARYWQAVRGDQLPAGLDIYCADFAVNSGPARAAKILQHLVGAEADSFIGPLTMEAVRKREPLQLLLDYHAARMEFLLGLSTWDKFGRGWTNRCNRVFAVAKDKVQRRPMMAEAAGSSIVKANGVAVAGSGFSLAWLLDQYGPIILNWIRQAAEDPQAIEKLQSGVTYVGNSTLAPMLLTGLAGALVATFGFGAFSIFKRMRMWQRGQV